MALLILAFLWAFSRSSALAFYRFCHLFSQGPINRSAEADFTSCNTTWGELMYRLKSVAEGKSRGPLFRVADLAY